MANLTISNRHGPLLLSTTNGRYFTDANGKGIFLAGFHTWGDLQDVDTTFPPATFDWDAYLQALVDYGCNFTKFWANETGRYWSDVDGYFYPLRYKRTGPGNDNDGKLKFDLTKINDEYIERLVRRCAECAQRGIYVCVQLFQGWQIEDKGQAGTPWTYHPYELANNINSVDGDQNNDGEGIETHLNTGANVVLTYQDALITEIVTRLNHLDNIFYEISNEDTPSTDNTSWQDRMVDKVHTVEASLPKQHPVGVTFQYPGGANTNLTGTSADWYSFSESTLDAPNSPTVSQCNMFDTDHITGLTATFEWSWRALCNGNGGAWYMDEWDGQLYNNDTRNSSAEVLIRQQLGYINTLMKLVKDLTGMTKQAALCSTGWCLAKNHATAAEYICYQDGTGNFTLNLSTATGTLNLRWLRCSDGTVSTTTVSGGAIRTLTPPWAGDVVAYVYH